MEDVYGWHLSPFCFSEPKINYKAGFGTSFYGAGFYITLDENVVDTMKAEAQDLFAEYFIYKIKVDERANIVDEDEENGLQLYAQLVEQFNGDEVKASEEMVKQGVDGILYWNEEDGHSIVFYNPKMAKIVHTDYHQGWGERTELNENTGKGDNMKKRFNEETQKIDVIEKANYQELVDSVYAAARSGVTNIRVRVRDDEYLDLLGDVSVDDEPLTESQKDEEKLLDEFYWNGLRIELVKSGNFICLYAYLENGDCCHNTIWGVESKKSAEWAWNDLKKYLEEFGESSDPVEVIDDWEKQLHVPNLNAKPGEKLYGPYEYTLDDCVKVVRNSMYGVIQSARGLKSTFNALKRHVANRAKYTDDFEGMTDDELMEIAQAVYDYVEGRPASDSRRFR